MNYHAIITSPGQEPWGRILPAANHKEAILRALSLRFGDPATDDQLPLLRDWSGQIANHPLTGPALVTPNLAVDITMISLRDNNGTNWTVDTMPTDQPMSQPDICPICGAKMEGTALAYLTVEGTALVLDDLDLDDISWYCSNDHPAEEHQAELLDKRYRGRLDSRHYLDITEEKQ